MRHFLCTSLREAGCSHSLKTSWHFSQSVQSIDPKHPPPCLFLPTPPLELHLEN